MQPCTHMSASPFLCGLVIFHEQDQEIAFSPPPIPTHRFSGCGCILIMSDAEEPLNLDSLSQEERIQLAIKAVINSGLTRNGRTKLSVRQAASTFKVPHSTLQDCCNGWKTRHEGHAHEQNLMPSQKEVVMECVKVMGRWGVPLTQVTLRDYASNICGTPVGETWPKQFIARHADVKVKWTTPLEWSHAQGLNPTIVAEYFKILKEVIDEYDIPHEKIYNMDEKGVQLGIGT